MKKKILIIISAILGVGILATAAIFLWPKKNAPENAVVKDPVADNARTFYQVFVGSFSDSNGDGIGDLRGLINRFDYLNDGNMNSEKSLGVQGIWLSPIFTSPSYHKYDAKDYYQIDWRFGTEEDLKELADLCQQRNVKLILDLAINHTSDQHPWFTQFKQARIDGNTEDPYYNYYSCVTTAEKQNGVTYQKIGGADCWYECNFSTQMPELNFDNEKVRQEMLDVAKYYMDLGVDGFRFDAVKYIYYGDTEKSVDFWKWYMDQLRKDYPDIYCVGECWSGETEILDYYAAMNCFNFAGSQAEGVFASAAKGSSMATYTGYIQSFQKKVSGQNPDSMPMSFLSNHDMDRIAGAFILEPQLKMVANLYLLSPGSPVIYYGEELGIRGSRGSENTDANRRLAMLWGDEDKIKDPVGSTYPMDKQITTTVASQSEDENSMLSHYRRLLNIRHRYEAIPRGTYTALSISEKRLGGFSVEYKAQTLYLLHNTDAEAISYDLSKLEISQVTLAESIGTANATLEGSVLTIPAHTSVVLTEVAK